MISSAALCKQTYVFVAVACFAFIFADYPGFRLSGEICYPINADNRRCHPPVDAYGSQSVDGD